MATPAVIILLTEIAGIVMAAVADASPGPGPGPEADPGVELPPEVATLRSFGRSRVRDVKTPVLPFAAQPNLISHRYNNALQDVT